MAICLNCEDEYSDARKALGYQTCLACGAVVAQEKIEEKAKRTAPICNKSAYQYITDGMIREDLKTLGRKT